MFEYDVNKSTANKEKHGIDFEHAKELWLDPDRIIIEAKTIHESRFLLIASLDEKTWCAVYTIRDGVIRIISVRRARNNEEEYYRSSKI